MEHVVHFLGAMGAHATCRYMHERVLIVTNKLGLHLVYQSEVKIGA